MAKVVKVVRRKKSNHGKLFGLRSRMVSQVTLRIVTVRLTSVAYYFWNTKTGEVTWVNPLQPQVSTQPPLPNEPPPLPSGPIPVPQTSHPEFGQLPDIDPALAHLLPPSERGLGMPADVNLAQRAAFNSRTGKFTPQDYYSPEHLSEYNRAKRMNSHYFDVEAWEREKAEESAKRRREEEEGGSSKKKISKKDMVRLLQ